MKNLAYAPGLAPRPGTASRLRHSHGRFAPGLAQMLRSACPSAPVRLPKCSGIRKKEAELAEKHAGKPVLGMKAALKIHWRTVPKDGEELFGRQPNFSTETVSQRIAMKRLRKSFPPEYADALAQSNAGQREVVFPAGTVRMRLRHNVATEPIPDFLRAS